MKSDPSNSPPFFRKDFLGLAIRRSGEGGGRKRKLICFCGREIVFVQLQIDPNVLKSATERNNCYLPPPTIRQLKLATEVLAAVSPRGGSGNFAKQKSIADAQKLVWLLTACSADVFFLMYLSFQKNNLRPHHVASPRPLLREFPLIILGRKRKQCLSERPPLKPNPTSRNPSEGCKEETLRRKKLI